MTIDQRRNLFYQQRLSLEVTQQMNDLISLLGKGLNLHLNLGQQFNMNTPGVMMSFETLSVRSLAEKEIQLVSNARIRLPAMFNGTERNSLRVRIQRPKERCPSLFSMFSPHSNRCLHSVSRTRISPDRSLSLDSMEMEMNFLFTPLWIKQ